eukprot:CAMPEP_0177658824 /NCGR_PEP_ID=MMETSP0447-20121125/17072_1 /TAXON_ID=0 /ORGANISM="Stygamoeba regulata, Strain BSH-02190019" /LENGTH=118 /DNA_ID=CAMNT_0019163567 /DNA_START=246 /DNA_END=602 /DNA_ORIENTATION=+
MGRLRRKRVHSNDKSIHRAYRTANRKKDIDQVWTDMQPGNKEKLENRAPDPDLPGLGQFYCLPCDRHFVDEEARKRHLKSQPHKRRMKTLKEEPYMGPEKRVDNGKPAAMDAEALPTE